ncbi:MAG: hypothetical protein AB7E55_28630 [Pigmentiphaga sp.]
MSAVGTRGARIDKRAGAADKLRSIEAPEPYFRGAFDAFLPTSQLRSALWQLSR